MRSTSFAPVSFRISSKLRLLIKRYIVISDYISESEFFRDTIREKLKHDVPKLYRKMYETLNENEPKNH